MKNRPPLGHVVACLFIFSLAGFWAIAYWSSPDDYSQSASREMASDTKLKYLNLTKHENANLEKDIIKPNLNFSEKRHEWFVDTREQKYQGHSYLISRDFYALPEDLYSDNAEVIKQSNGWVYFKDLTADGQGYQLWQDTNNGAIFIATGRILIHIENDDRVQDILSMYDFEVSYKTPGRNVFLVNRKSERNVIQIIEELKLEEGVLKVEFELIGPAHEPR